MYLQNTTDIRKANCHCSTWCSPVLSCVKNSIFHTDYLIDNFTWVDSLTQMFHTNHRFTPRIHSYSFSNGHPNVKIFTSLYKNSFFWKFQNSFLYPQNKSACVLYIIYSQAMQYPTNTITVTFLSFTAKWPTFDRNSFSGIKQLSQVMFTYRSGKYQKFSDCMTVIEESIVERGATHWIQAQKESTATYSNIPGTPDTFGQTNPHVSMPKISPYLPVTSLFLE